MGQPNALRNYKHHNEAIERELGSICHRPGDVLKHFKINTAQNMYCSHDKQLRHCQPAAEALKFPYVSFGNDKEVFGIGLDIDRSDAAEQWRNWEFLPDGDESWIFPAPTLILENPDNGHCHFLYLFEHRLVLNSPIVVDMLNDLAAAMAMLPNVDKVFSGQRQLIKNPLHPAHRTIVPREASLWTLTELLNHGVIKRNLKKVKHAEAEREGVVRRLRHRPANIDVPSLDAIMSGEAFLMRSAKMGGGRFPVDDSRNNALFVSAHFYAKGAAGGVRGDEEKLRQMIHDYIGQQNHCELLGHFSRPLPAREIREIAKSVSSWIMVNRPDLKGGHKTGNRGVMGLPTLKGVWRSREDWEAKKKEYQSAGAGHTHKTRRGSTKARILKAISDIQLQGKRPTQALTAKMSGVSLRTVKSYWSEFKSEFKNDGRCLKMKRCNMLYQEGYASDLYASGETGAAKKTEKISPNNVRTVTRQWNIAEEPKMPFLAGRGVRGEPAAAGVDSG